MCTERRILQIMVGIAGLVPVAAGAVGAVRPELLDLAGLPSATTHAAYLSGLLLGIGLGFWSLLPSIEKQSRTFTLLTGFVVLGGLARLFTAFRLDTWDLTVTLPLAMELVVTPALCWWCLRVARRTKTP